MKITFNLEQCDYPHREFLSKEEWDKFEYSQWYRDNKWKSGTYQPLAWAEPQKFPCIALEGPCLNNSSGADHQIFHFIYDYTLTE